MPLLHIRNEVKPLLKMKIGLFTDPHYCNADVLCKTRRPRLSIQKMRCALDEFKKNNVDICICLGDITDRAPNATKEEGLECFKEVLALINSYGIPFYFVPGNHDYGVATGEELERLIGSALPPYTADVCGIRFIALDANYRSDMNRYDVAGVLWTDSNLPPDQIAYLSTALAESPYPCVVLSHENLDPNIPRTVHIIKNAEQARDIIRASGKVKAVLQGHYHKGADNMIDGIRYLTLPAMCEGEQNSYCILEF